MRATFTAQSIKMMLSLPRPLLILLFLCMHSITYAAAAKEFRGKVTDEAGAPLTLATVKVQSQDIIYYSGADGIFSIPLATGATELTITISHIGRESITRNYNGAELEKLQVIKMLPLNLKLPEVEVNGVRRKTSASNSSIIFDREAIEQAQALSVANVLNYLPGQTILKPTISIQGATVLTLRTAIPPNTDQALNQAFGISVQIDGNTISNDANMQAINPAAFGFFGAHQIDHPENNFIRDRSYRNGTLYKGYLGDVANNGIDLRQIPAENIERIEVISGVASARYGDYTTGITNIERQAGITPLRVNVRTNEGTQNIGLNKGFKVSPHIGVLNFSLDFLNSNDDPRNKLKAFQRIGGSVLWTYKQDNAFRFRNTFGIDVNTTLDRTKRDFDEGTERMAKFSNRNVRVSNRSEWIINTPWIYNISLQGSFSAGRQESYEQRYVNSNAVMGITDAIVTGIHEGYFVPGYYLGVQQIIGEPVTASGRIEARSIFKSKKTNNILTFGANYSHTSNKGPGVIIDISRPFLDGGDKNGDRPRPFRQLPEQNNIGVYLSNNLNTKLLGRSFNADAGIRGDFQNKYFSITPRINANWRILKDITWNIAYGIATKAPSLSQISPGDVYTDIPLVNAYNGYAAESVYLAYTHVFNGGNPDLRPYRSYTFETGFNVDAKAIQLSVYYYNRTYKDGFATSSRVLPVELPSYTVTPRPGQKPLYEPSGTTKTWHLGYSVISNAAWSRTNGVELMVSTQKIRALQTSVSATTSFNHTYFLNKAEDVSIYSNGQEIIDITKDTWYGVFKNQASKALNIKSTIVTSTHIPALRMVVIFSGELFWVNRLETLFNGIYPVGYIDRYGKYFPLTPEQARSDEYLHLRKKVDAERITYTPSMVYPNVGMRVSKEIGDVLRFSFNAYNVFNIRPVHQTSSGTDYYNGQPSFGAELIFTIK